MNHKERLTNSLATTLKGWDIPLYCTQWHGKVSRWSKCLCQSKERDEVKTAIEKTFMLSDKQFDNAFMMAVSGDGNEAEKICTLHSSSLLALLCFHNVCDERPPLTIDGFDYTQCLFEVKNDVIKADLGKPSNIDILLVAKRKDGSVKKLLFLESKFTEYFNGGKVKVSNERYLEFYKCIQKIELDFNVNVGEDIVELSSKKRPTPYLAGIKQAFSHLLGIATGPSDGQEEYSKLFIDAPEIEFATIMNDGHKDKFNAYAELYKNVFKHEVAIKNALRKVVKQRDAIDILHINPNIMTYKEVFKNFDLPPRVREFYKL